MFSHSSVDVDIIWTLCYVVSSDYFFLTSCLTHFTSLSYSSENMIANNWKKDSPSRERELLRITNILFSRGWYIWSGPDYLYLAGQARGALAAMTLYFISGRTGALIGQPGGSREPLTTGHSRTSPGLREIETRERTWKLITRHSGLLFSPSLTLININNPIDRLGGGVLVGVGAGDSSVVQTEDWSLAEAQLIQPPRGPGCPTPPSHLIIIIRLTGTAQTSTTRTRPSGHDHNNILNLNNYGTDRD